MTRSEIAEIVHRHLEWACVYMESILVERLIDELNEQVNPKVQPQETHLGELDQRPHWSATLFASVDEKARVQAALDKRYAGYTEEL